MEQGQQRQNGAIRVRHTRLSETRESRGRQRAPEPSSQLIGQRIAQQRSFYPMCEVVGHRIRQGADDQQENYQSASKSTDYSSETEKRSARQTEHRNNPSHPRIATYAEEQTRGARGQQPEVTSEVDVWAESLTNQIVDYKGRARIVIGPEVKTLQLGPSQREYAEELQIKQKENT
jgi:hypothetical protein